MVLKKLDIYMQEMNFDLNLIPYIKNNIKLIREIPWLSSG